MFLTNADIDAPAPQPIGDNVLMAATETLTNQLTRKEEYIGKLVDSLSILELHTLEMTKNTEQLNAKIKSLENVLATRNRQMNLKELNIRALQTALKTTKEESYELKKFNLAQTKKLNDQNAKMQTIMAENQRLKHLTEN